MSVFFTDREISCNTSYTFYLDLCVSERACVHCTFLSVSLSGDGGDQNMIKKKQTDKNRCFLFRKFHTILPGIKNFSVTIQFLI